MRGARRLLAPAVSVVWVARAQRNDNALSRGVAPAAVEPTTATLAVRDGLNCHASYQQDVAVIDDMLGRIEKIWSQRSKPKVRK